MKALLSSTANMTTETYRSVGPGSRASISYGVPFTDSARKHVDETFQASKVYVLASASLAASTKEVENLQNALGDRIAGVQVGMKPHTLWSECLNITQDARRVQADLILTIGGGSLTDAAKIVSLALANGVSDFEGMRELTTSGAPSSPVKEPTVPIICIPTTLSGGEYNDHAGGTNDETRQKFSFQSPVRGPQLVILDPALTAATPEKWWLSTGIRAVDHCVEAMCSLKGNAQSDQDATAGLQKLVPGLLRCKQDSSDLEARLQCQLAVISAVKATKNAPMGASHGIGHQLGPLGVGHGETSCVLLPAVCAYNMSANEERQLTVCRIFKSDTDTWPAIQQHLHTLVKNVDNLPHILHAYFGLLGMPRSLAAVGVKEDQFEALAKNSLKDRHLPTNPIPITTAEQVVEILRIAYDNKN